MERESEASSSICIACVAAAIVNCDFDRLADLLTTPTGRLEKVILRPNWIFDEKDNASNSNQQAGLIDEDSEHTDSGVKELETLGSGRFPCEGT